MDRLKSILLATDLTEAALPVLRRAVTLATENQARLTVVTSGPDGSRSAVSASFNGHFAERRARRLLNGLAREVQADHELRWIAQSPQVDAVEHILRSAEDADLVVLGAGSGSCLQSLFFGTTAERVVRLLRRPVLVVKRRRSMACAAYRYALVPVDLTQATACAVAWAARVAPRASLHLLHALSLPRTSRMRLADCSYQSMQATVQRAQTASLHRLWGVAANLRTHRTFATVKEDHPVVLTLQKSRETAADLIVVGKSGRSVLGDFLLGSTAQRLLSESDIDLLVVPKSPVPPQRATCAPVVEQDSMASGQA